MVVFSHHFNNVDHSRRVFINGDRIKFIFTTTLSMAEALLDVVHSLQSCTGTRTRHQQDV